MGHGFWMWAGSAGAGFSHLFALGEGRGGAGVRSGLGWAVFRRLVRGSGRGWVGFRLLVTGRCGNGMGRVAGGAHVGG